MASLLVALPILVVSAVVVWVGAALLERGSLRVARHHGLPAVVEGAIVLAIGSSFPELASVVIATLLHGAFDLGVGVIVGSALFNMLVIPAVSVMSSGSMATDRDLVFKEGLFYLFAVAAVFGVFALARVQNPLDGVGLLGSLTRPLALSLVALYGLYLVFQWADSRGEAAEPLDDGAALKAWGLVAAGLVLILVSSEGLVRGALMLGDILGTSSFVWGVTVIAVATSLPDLFASVRAARADRGRTSLANAIGSNTFDVLVALPAGVVLAGAATVNLSTAGPMVVVLGLSTMLMIVFLRTDMRLSRPEAHAALVAYAVGLAALLEVGGAMNVVGWL